MGKPKGLSVPSSMSGMMKLTLSYMIREGKPTYPRGKLPPMRDGYLEKMEFVYGVIEELYPGEYRVTDFGRTWGKRYLKR